MVDEVLRHCGAVVTTYESAETALQHLGEFLPSVFICDLSMPGLDGMQFMKRIRAPDNAAMRCDAELNSSLPRRRRPDARSGAKRPAER